MERRSAADAVRYRIMAKIAIVTDSNSGITQAQAKELGIRVLPMPFYINGELYFEDITLTQEEFYQKLSEDADISTSQPSPASVTDLWDEVLKDFEEIVYIPMSSGLSSSCETAMALAKDYGGKVRVIDNQRISITQRQSVLDAIEMAGKGMPPKEIASAAGVPPFAVGKYQAQAKAFTKKELRKIIEAGADLEESVKTGRLGDRLSVELFIVEFSRKA